MCLIAIFLCTSRPTMCDLQFGLQSHVILVISRSCRMTRFAPAGSPQLRDSVASCVESQLVRHFNKRGGPSTWPLQDCRMQSDAGCQVCETLSRPLTCAPCLCQPKHFGGDWTRLEQLRNTREAARARLETAMSLQVCLEQRRRHVILVFVQAARLPQGRHAGAQRSLAGRGCPRTALADCCPKTGPPLLLALTVVSLQAKRQAAACQLGQATAAQELLCRQLAAAIERRGQGEH